MYLSYYKLAEQPFGVTPNPRYLYLSETHKEAMASVFHGVLENRGFTALIAHPGMGKTTLLFDLLQRAPASLKTVFLFQTQCGPQDLLRSLLADLGVSGAGQDMAQMQAQLNEILLHETGAGRRVVVVVDEAQNLGEPVLEVLRVLSNFETTHEKLMHVVLAGQPELARKLSSSAMAQLRQRVSVVARLAPFNARETRAYIEHRLQVAGYSGSRPLFTDRAYDLIAVHSQGVPRNINNLCFNAMSLGCALQKKVIGPEIIREVLGDLDMNSLFKRATQPELGDQRACKQDADSVRRERTPLRGAFIRVAFAMSVVAMCLTMLPGRFSPLTTNSSLSPLADHSTSSKSAVAAAPGVDAGRVIPAVAPVPATQASIPDPYRFVQLGEGETLYALCIRYFGRYDAQAIQELRKLNPGLSDPKRIRAGTSIRVPANTLAAGESVGERPRESQLARPEEKNNEQKF